MLGAMDALSSPWSCWLGPPGPLSGNPCEAHRAVVGHPGQELLGRARHEPLGSSRHAQEKEGPSAWPVGAASCVIAVGGALAFHRQATKHGKRRPRSSFRLGAQAARSSAHHLAGSAAAHTIRPIRTIRIASAAAPEWTAGQQDTREFGSEEDCLKDSAKAVSKIVGNGRLKFVAVEAPDIGELPMNLTLIALDEPTEAWAAVFTQNAFPGAPVKVGRSRQAAGVALQAVVVNNKISNVMPGDEDGGVGASEKLCQSVARELDTLGSGPRSVLPCSTGVIGWRLPADDMMKAIPALVASLQPGSALPAAKGIMTTDRYPKLSSVQLPGGGRIVGVAKGAGMIEPNMATMLGYLLTDVTFSRQELQEMLDSAIGSSFNSISVDGDESTSDTVVLLSSCKLPPAAAGAASEASRRDFEAGLREVCSDLAAQLVHNGEGTQHVIRVAVTGAVDDATAKRVGRAVVNGPLFKCAVAGNDPNVGRLIGKVGQALGAEGTRLGMAGPDCTCRIGGEAIFENGKFTLDALGAEGTRLGMAGPDCTCRIGGEAIFENGKFTLDAEKEKRLSAHLKFAAADSSLKYPPHRRVVDVEVCLGGGGSGQAVVLGSDLTTEYVLINADYRS
ncbi:unnamed protein product [Polarella glacialis]|uniref:Arginine biosynthesis bifunctional protein ArgJ, mitochondrial n=1 Tax=Polarella glacialis TaxID=89957 RepID=A0A813IDQ9_POLGL|nr:unnamed protein product [Polarella glacialis]